MSSTPIPMFRGAVAITTTKYVPVPIVGGRIGIQIAWLDAVSAATITLELTGWPSEEAPVDDAGASYEWKDSGQTIVGPAATAAGSVLVNIENANQARGRLKIVTTANSSFAIWNGV